MTVHSGFFSHTKLALTGNPAQYGDYHKNLTEKLGNLLLYPSLNLPKGLINALYNPKVLTVAFTALALIGVQFAFYPITSALLLEKALVLISAYITPEIAKLAAYVFIQTAIVGLGTRAMGRFTNEGLMNKFYGVPTA
jgi:hypothetical protein